MSLPTLQAILAAHDDLATVPAPDFRGWVSDGSEYLVPVVVAALLERTAVVHPAGRSDERQLLRLDAIHVSPAAIHWVPRSRHELDAMRSRARVGANRRDRQSQSAPLAGESAT